MIINYFKVAVRQFNKYRLQTVMNVVGLACGVLTMSLALLYWSNERRFDTFHSNADRLWRITSARNVSGDDRVMLGTTGQVQGPAFKEAVPEVETYVRIFGGDIQADVLADGKTFRIKPLFVDSTFLNVFTFRLLSGHVTKALRSANAIVITESMARKFFGSTDVTGELMSMDSDPSFDRLKEPLVITGVVADPPATSSIQFDALLTFDFLRLSFADYNWMNAYLGTFVLLQPGADVRDVIRRFDEVYETQGRKQATDTRYNSSGIDPEIKYGLQPLSEIHFNPLLSSEESNESGIVNGGDIRLSIAFLVVAGFVLLMAAMNFITMTLAGNLLRRREVAIRKISGSGIRQLMVQFVMESSLICTSSFILALGMLYLLLPGFNSYTGKTLTFHDLVDIYWLLSVFATFILIIGVTGIYPAWLISRQKTIDALHHRIAMRASKDWGRGRLTIQLLICVLLLFAALVYHAQMRFVRTRDLGYNPHNVIHTQITGNRNYETALAFIRQGLRMESAVVSTSFGNSGWFEKARADEQDFKAFVKRVDEHFLEVMDIPVARGRNFSSDLLTDREDAALVNEAFVRSAAWTDGIGETIEVTIQGEQQNRKVVGVIKDYHFRSLHERVSPMVLLMNTANDGDIWIKFNQDDERKAIAALNQVYEAAAPGAWFDYQFLDESNAKDYVQEQRAQALLNFATILAMVICCCGLFGLARLSANQRTKEIGVRKVMGASVTQISSMIAFDFVRPVGIACLVGIPVGWFAATYWLSGFAYHTSSLVVIMIVTVVAALVITFTTVGLHAVKSAKANPVDTLRSH